MKLGRTILAHTFTKSGPVDVTVNVVCDGPADGAAAVIREMSDGVAGLDRLRHAFVISPVVEVPFDSVETAAMDDSFDGVGQGYSSDGRVITGCHMERTGPTQRPRVLESALRMACQRIADGPQRFEEANTADGWARVFIAAAESDSTPADVTGAAPPAE